MRVGSAVLVLDQDQRIRELEASERLLREARETAARAAAIAAKVERMDRIYRERLVGRRDVT